MEQNARALIRALMEVRPAPPLRFSLRVPESINGEFLQVCFKAAAAAEQPWQLCVGSAPDQGCITYYLHCTPLVARHVAAALSELCRKAGITFDSSS